MSVEIRMPKLSDNMEEGTVIRWIVTKGQSVAVGDSIAEVETDKANVEIEAEESGVVSEIVVQAGGVAAVGAVLAVLDGGGESTRSAGGDAGAADASENGAGDEDGAAPPARREANAAAREATKDRGAPAPGVEQRRAPKGDGGGRDARAEKAPIASPVARDLAAQRGVDLSRVRGSGPGGRIVKADVESASGSRQAERGATAARDESGAAEGGSEAEGVAEVRADAGETMSRMRRTIAARMEKSKREIPHFYVRADVEADALMNLYETIRADELVPGLTLTHLLLRAIAIAMPNHRRLNALWVDDSIQLMDDVNIGVVVALDDGLLVPVVRRAQALGLRDLVEQAVALVDRTRKGRFRSDDLTGGTISVSNIGMLDVDELTPIINAPQASILGVGAVREKALVRNGALVAGRSMTLTLACDHRVVNGVEAGRFLEELKHVLERPLGLVMSAGRVS